MEDQMNSRLKLAFDFVSYTNQNLFLTGKAGTGKTTFLHDLRQKTFKRLVVVAPTGVAAINAGGVTIHSFFQLSFGPQIPGTGSAEVNNGRSMVFKRFSKEKINIIRSLDLLVIDEISMVRADVLDAIDAVLRRFRDRDKPFGGVQLLMIGDLQQLAPIIKEEEWELLKPYYDTGFFFSSNALRKASFQSIELKKIFRQEDEDFIYLLNKIRDNNIEPTELEALNKRYMPGFKPDDKDGYITLTTHNYQANEINQSKLDALKQKSYTFSAVISDDFPEYMYPTDPELILKKGAQVMFVKNDSSPEKRYFNGKIGKISEINASSIMVKCPDDQEAIQVETERWDNTKYTLNEDTQEIQEEVTGSFSQYPLKLAWAITIHKSQGLTFEKAIINARQSFAHGQVYVALSRCKSLEGMVLSSPIDLQSIKSDISVLSFTKEAEAKQPTSEDFQKARTKYQRYLLSELFDFSSIRARIQYAQYLCNENKNILLGDLPDQLAQIQPVLKEELISVADKFRLQIDSLLPLSDDIEHNTLLQERITKASHYFSEKLEQSVTEQINAGNYETDNKKVQKQLGNAVEELQRELRIKAKVLYACRDGFSVVSYLEARAKASVDKTSSWKRRSRDEKVSTVSKHPDFYRQLGTWRSVKADELNVSTSRIIRQTALLEIADLLPATAVELKSIRGMGGKKIKQFGKEILEMVIRFRKELNLDLPANAEKEPEKAMLDSKGVSFSMFKTGKSPLEIAQARGMAVSTVEGHLAQFVSHEEFNLDRLVVKEKQDKILREIKRKPYDSLTELKQRLGEDIGYGDIRFVLAFHKAERNG
ncbi:helix-turn-helix domain-containing protein [Saccharicrinis sp. FJH54]|uniref:helix-turn-helix domain-containing protein n=1 Tax=Saccharicrinis sp. FJH54 TaxID=3344665 RepID=UPI0035D3E299